MARTSINEINAINEINEINEINAINNINAITSLYIKALRGSSQRSAAPRSPLGLLAVNRAALELLAASNICGAKYDVAYLCSSTRSLLLRLHYKKA